MIPITTHENIVKNFYSKILEQSGLEEGRVLNKETANGADLIKIINSTDATSFRLEDTFITFDVAIDNNEPTYISDEENGYMSTIVPYRTNLQIYGNGSYTMAQKLLARFDTNEVKEELYSKGIWITHLVYVENVKEFVNNTLWTRNDILLGSTSRISTAKLHDCGTFNADSLKKLTIESF